MSIKNYLSSNNVLFVQATRVKEVKEQEEEVLQAQSYPLRNYLMKHVMPTLNQGLIEVCKVRPEDAIDYLVSKFKSPNHSNETQPDKTQASSQNRTLT